MMQKQPTKTLKKLEAIRAKNPKDPKIHNLIGEVYIVQQSYAKAQKSFQMASKLKPDWTIPYQNLARAHLLKKDVKGAIAAYKRGLKATNNNITLAVTLASLYEQNGDIETAIKEYESLLEKNTALDLVANNLAMLLVTHRSDQHSLDRAQELVNRFKQSNLPDFIDTLGWVLYKRGSVDEAITYLEKAMKIAPDAGVINYHLGMAYVNKNMSSLAQKYLTKAVEDKTDFAGKKEARAALKKVSGG